MSHHHTPAERAAEAVLTQARFASRDLPLEELLEEAGGDPFALADPNRVFVRQMSDIPIRDAGIAEFEERYDENRRRSARRKRARARKRAEEN